MSHTKQLQDIFIGQHNADLERARGRLIRGNTYRDVSTVCIIPTRGMIPARVVQSWLGMMQPMNQKFMRIFVEKYEVGDAYNAGIETVLNHPELSAWKYILTIEEDNCPPPDGLIKLYEAMETKAANTGNKLDVIEGLYWTKGENGQPMIYGDAKVQPRNYIPQLPMSECLQECYGLGMGFNLWKLEMFKKVPKPWFKTVQEYIPGQGVKLGTQDMFFFDNAAKYGYRFGCDTRIKVGHWDQSSSTMW